MTLILSANRKYHRILAKLRKPEIALAGSAPSSLTSIQRGTVKSSPGIAVWVPYAVAGFVASEASPSNEPS